ncbi:MAG: ABC transporter permease subunit [Clostridium sp.]|uniref:ABC transporter permease n=1 Tax=Clostridium sp. TaxID=1506 RepID=UPI003064DEF2
MMSSIIRNNWRRIFSIVFWIFLWQVISILVGREILIVSPITVVKTLLELVKEIGFWSSLYYSFIRIAIGFLFAVVVGILLASVSSQNILFRELLYPPTTIIKSTPVASFIIIALIWIKSENLSVFISFLMVLPIIYTNTLKGIENADKKLLEMAQVFKVGVLKKIRYIYIPEIMPFFISACSVSLGLCWKSGIAAEVIGLPKGSIGEKLYQAKIFLNTGELFAWTLVIIIVSIAFEKVFIYLLKKVQVQVVGSELER